MDNFESIRIEISKLMNENSDLLQASVGLGTFIVGVVILGGIIVFGILSTIFSKKAA